jgi:hypothetical protein
VASLKFDFLIGEFPEWSKGADCKSVGSAFEGSNPPLPIHEGLSIKDNPFFITRKKLPDHFQGTAINNKIDFHTVLYNYQIIRFFDCFQLSDPDEDLMEIKINI